MWGEKSDASCLIGASPPAAASFPPPNAEERATKAEQPRGNALRLCPCALKSRGHCSFPPHSHFSTCRLFSLLHAWLRAVCCLVSMRAGRGARSARWAERGQGGQVTGAACAGWVIGSIRAAARWQDRRVRAHTRVADRALQYHFRRISCSSKGGGAAAE